MKAYIYGATIKGARVSGATKIKISLCMICKTGTRIIEGHPCTTCIALRNGESK